VPPRIAGTTWSGGAGRRRGGNAGTVGERVHRCGVLAAESRAGQRKYHDIEHAVADLHGMLDALR
jgi:hypothetical protein